MNIVRKTIETYNLQSLFYISLYELTITVLSGITRCYAFSVIQMSFLCTWHKEKRLILYREQTPLIWLRITYDTMGDFNGWVDEQVAMYRMYVKNVDDGKSKMNFLSKKHPSRQIFAFNFYKYRNVIKSKNIFEIQSHCLKNYVTTKKQNNKNRLNHHRWHDTATAVAN